MCELMLSLVQGDVLNKKTALDRVMATSSFDGRQLGKASRMVTMTLNRIHRMFLRKLDVVRIAFCPGKLAQYFSTLPVNRLGLFSFLGRMEEHLAANQVDLKNSPATLGAVLKLDVTKESFIGNSAASQMLTREYR